MSGESDRLSVLKKEAQRFLDRAKDKDSAPALGSPEWLVEKMLQAIVALMDTNEELEKRLWGWSRGLVGQEPYSEEELREMFAPYVENGDVTGLSPREARLLETVVSTGARVVQLEKEHPEVPEASDIDNYTVGEARALFEAQAKSDEGASCPVCYRPMKGRKRYLNKSICSWLVGLNTMFVGPDGVHYKDLRPYQVDNDYSFARHWGLAESYNRLWRPTKLLDEFMAGEKKLPGWVFVLNNRRVASSEKKVDWETASSGGNEGGNYS